MRVLPERMRNGMFVQKAKDALGVSPHGFSDAPGAVLAGLQRHARHLLNDPLRDVDRFDFACLREVGPPTVDVLCGWWGSVPRLAAHLTIENAEARVIFCATKGTKDAIDVMTGATGPDIGNSTLVVATLHIAIFYLRASGIVAITNEPHNPSLADKYEDMGFLDGGTRLPLDDRRALERAFEYIEDVYGQRGISLASRPPLPL
jgi:hypothetical protein